MFSPFERMMAWRYLRSRKAPIDAKNVNDEWTGQLEPSPVPARATVDV